MTDSGEVTQLLDRWQAGEAEAQEELVRVIYGELLRLAAIDPGLAQVAEPRCIGHPATSGNLTDR